MGHPRRKTVHKGYKRPNLRLVTDQVLQDKDAYEGLTQAVAKSILKEKMSAFFDKLNISKAIKQVVSSDASVRDIFSDLDDDGEVIPTDPNFSRKAFLERLSKITGFQKDVKKALVEEIEDD